WNLDALGEMERDTGKKIHPILQLRLHPSILALRDRIRTENLQRRYDVDLTYVTSRGPWYLQSWKGDAQKSGGITSNIGVHFYDALHFLFGALQRSNLHYLSDTRAAGYLEYENARVRWFLSIDGRDLPETLRVAGQRTLRSIRVDEQEIEFSDGF